MEVCILNPDFGSLCEHPCSLHSQRPICIYIGITLAQVELQKIVSLKFSNVFSTIPFLLMQKDGMKHAKNKSMRVNIRPLNWKGCTIAINFVSEQSSGMARHASPPCVWAAHPMCLSPEPSNIASEHSEPFINANAGRKVDHELGVGHETDGGFPSGLRRSGFQVSAFHVCVSLGLCALPQNWESLVGFSQSPPSSPSSGFLTHLLLGSETCSELLVCWCEVQVVGFLGELKHNETYCCPFLISSQSSQL